MQDNAGRAASHSGRLEQCVKGCAVTIRQIAKELGAGDETQRLCRRRIGLNDSSIADPHKGNGLRRCVEQRAVSSSRSREASSNPAHAPSGQTPSGTLGRKWPRRFCRLQQIRPLAKLDSRILEHELAAAWQPLSNGKAGRLPFPTGGLYSLGHLLRRLRADGVGPAQPAPLLKRFVRKRLRGYSAPNHPFAIYGESDIRGKLRRLYSSKAQWASP